MRPRKRRPPLAGSNPKTDTSPPSPDREPSRISTSVVLPATLGPSNATTSPRDTSSDTDRSTAFPPYDFSTLEATTAGSATWSSQPHPTAPQNRRSPSARQERHHGLMLH